MLRELSVEDLAVIESLNITFEGGMTALTGETGTGKSVLLSALSLGLGARGDAGVVRAGCDNARVELVFELPETLTGDAGDAGQAADGGGALGGGLRSTVEEMGIPAEDDGTLILSRTIGADGRSRCRANGQTITVSMLSALGDLLADFHGQHEHQRLFDRATHSGYVDAYIGERAVDAHRAYSAARSAYLEAAQAMDEVTADARAATERLAAIKREHAEISSAAITGPDEEETLFAARERSRHIDRLRSAALAAYFELEREEPLSSGDGAVSGLARAVSALRAVADADAALAPLVATLENAYAEVSECASELSRYVTGLDAEPRDLDSIEERLHLFKGLRERFGPSLAEVIETGRRLAEDIEAQQAFGDPIEAAHHKKEAAAEELTRCAAVLTALRRSAAEKMSKDVGAFLARMNLPADGFTVDLTPLDPFEAGPAGAERIEFLVSLNPGEPAAPLKDAASGGEASRLLLAVKLALRGADPIGTSVFDEVDAGVGGEAARTVGTLLKELSGGAQVLCVTHLPQVASCADHHVRLEKSVSEGRTRTIARRVEGDERVEEVARMLSGDAGSDIGLAHAKEMIAGGR